VGGLAVACALFAASPAIADWQPPQPIDNGSGYSATEPNQTALATGPNGLTTVLFFQPPSTPSGAAAMPFMARRAAGTSTSWSAPAAIATPGGQPVAAPNPALAGSAGGALGTGGSLGVFGFQPSSGSVGVVSAAWPASGSSPGAATAALCTSGTTPECASDTASPAQVAIDGAGNGYAVGEVTSGTGFGDILFARTDPSTGSWQPAQLLAKSSQLPLIAVDPAGDVVVTYAVQDTSTPGLYDYHEYAVRELAGETSFSAPVQISGPNSISALRGQLALVIDPSGTATAVFLEDTVPPTVFAPSAPAVEAVRWLGGRGTTPSSEQPISASVSGGNPTGVTLAVDPAGRVTAAWDAQSPGDTVFANQYRPGGGWSVAQQVSAQNSPDNYVDAQVAADSDGTATVVYLDASNAGAGTTNVDAQALPAGGAWSAPAVISSTTTGAGSVQSGSVNIAAATPGQADVIFVQALNGTNRLFATRFVDTTAPSIQIVTPQDGASYKQGATVLADYSCTDPDSAVSSCAGPVANGQAIDTSTPGSHAFTVTASDPSGNTASKTVTYSVQAGPPPKDTAPPTVSISLPRSGAAYDQGQVVDARYSCSDPDLSSCSGTVAKGHPIDTRTTGLHSFSVTAQDVSGNTGSETIHYTVVPHNTTSSCHARPLSRIDKRGVRASRKGLNVSGTASEHVCAGASAATHRRNRVVKVYVMIYHPAPRGRCRFLRRNGTLTRPIPCGHPIELVARGTGRWALRPRIHIPAIAGGYLVRADAVDGFGRHQARSPASVVHVVVR